MKKLPHTCSEWDTDDRNQDNLDMIAIDYCKKMKKQKRHTLQEAVNTATFLAYLNGRGLLDKV